MSISTILFFSRKSLAKFVLITIIIVCTLGVFREPIFDQANQALGVLVPGSKLKPIYYVDTQEKKIAISFDATWGAEYTPKILDILKKYNIKTTFFLTNIWLKEYSDVAKQIRLAGHEIGMHSVTHPHLNQLSEEQIVSELQGNAKMIEEITKFQAKLFRPPFGEYNNKVIRVTESLGYIPIQWSIDSLDWVEKMTKQDIVNRVTKRLHPGAIILFHNNGRYTADALEEIIQYILKQGYIILPISELIYKEDYFIDHQGAQKLKKIN
ncbi:MAG: peptidoglycan-N-acetylglucosamine deacetylase [Clostridia bacterium]|jgi:polysaccharide deacetylase family sporulation protein PdaB|nr:peptidoglycan-N-acetylglucosamine deacetylase [Clostridia bacterium]MDN5323611.1 peptidoglycan-N-acetylglucosamine deacetylase [Clostridia bacterium]